MQWTFVTMLADSKLLYVHRFANRLHWNPVLSHHVVYLISLHWQNGEDISAYISPEDATGDLMIVPLKMDRNVLFRVSRGMEEWNHAFTRLKASSLYRLMLQLEIIKSNPKVRNSLQASLLQRLMYPNFAFLPQNSPLLAFVTVNGEDVADVQVGISRDVGPSVSCRSNYC